MTPIRNRMIARVPSLAGKISGAAALSAALATPGTLSSTTVGHPCRAPLSCS